MTRAQEFTYLRVRAQRVLNDDAGQYTMLTRQLAIGLLELLDMRDQGAQLEADRFHAELAEVRDGITMLAAKTVAMPTYRREMGVLSGGLSELSLTVSMLEQRVNAIAATVERLTTDQTTDHTA